MNFWLQQPLWPPQQNASCPDWHPDPRLCCGKAVVCIYVCVCECVSVWTVYHVHSPQATFFFSLPFLPDIFNLGSNGCVYKSRVHSQQSRSVLIVHTNTHIKTHTCSQTHDSHVFHPLARQRVRLLERRLHELLNHSEMCKTILKVSVLIFLFFLSVVVFKLWINKPVRALDSFRRGRRGKEGQLSLHLYPKIGITCPEILPDTIEGKHQLKWGASKILFDYLPSSKARFQASAVLYVFGKLIW